MTAIDLTETALFKNFAEITTDDIYVDLHNEFDCYSIDYLQKQGQLSLSFKASKNNSRTIQHVELIFKNVTVELMNFKIDNSNSEWTIDTIYRGRFADQNDGLGEISNQGKYYYYINFYADYSFEVFSDSVIAELKS
ncbi:MAG: hypothetical protein JWQ63_2422 [Mucilaginibacter sp.]|nr:hypothetical protein [Mucilaginibacter sp.]